MNNRFIDWTALTLVIIGAVNWGLIGFFQFDLVAALFGSMGAAGSRVVYGIIGLAGLYCLTLYHKFDTVGSDSAIQRH